MPLFQTITIAFVAGILPSLLWLWFWMREEKCHHDPTRYICFAFLSGAIAVPLVLPFQHLTSLYLTGPIVIILWATAEETLKYLATHVTVLKKKTMDAPLDALIFMISAALGFSALENALFLFGPLQDGDTVQAILTGNLRFVGATLLHTVASATVGLGIAYAFYKKKYVQRIALILSLILAITLHSIFNFLIMNNQGGMFHGFLFVWAGIVLLLLLFEKVKANSHIPECTF